MFMRFFCTYLYLLAFPPLHSQKMLNQMCCKLTNSLKVDKAFHLIGPALIISISIFCIEILAFSLVTFTVFLCILPSFKVDVEKEKDPPTRYIISTDRAESLVAANSQTADGYNKEDHFDDDSQQKSIDTSSQMLKQLQRVLSKTKCGHILEERAMLLSSDEQDGYFKDLVSDEVTLVQLECLEDTNVRIIQTVAANWHDLALVLKFEGYVCKAIEKSHPMCCQDCCRDMFGRWINGAGTQPHTWIALAEALQIANYNAVAEQVLNWLLGRKTTPMQSVPTAESQELVTEIMKSNEILTREELQRKSKEDLEKIAMQKEAQLQTLQNKFCNVTHKREKEIIMIRQQLINCTRVKEASKATEGNEHALEVEPQCDSATPTLEPTTGDLQDLVASSPDSWREFGVQLNMDPELLDDIWKESNYNEEDSFKQVLKIWKTRKTVPYTWMTMCDILETPQVNCHSLSRNIKSRMCSFNQRAIKLHELYDVQGIRVLDEVAPSWEAVAPFLGFDENMIKTIQRDMHGDTSRGCRLMFEKWLKGASHQPPTWETLAGALNQAELNALANKIETEVVRGTSGATSSGSNSTPIPAMSQASTAQLPHANGKGNTQTSHNYQSDTAIDEQLLKNVEKTVKQLGTSLKQMRCQLNKRSGGQQSSDDAEVPDRSWMDEVTVPQGTGVEELISKYKILQTQRQRLQPLCEDTLCEIVTSNSDMELVQNNNEKMQQGERFEVKTKEVKLHKTPLNAGEYVTNCHECQFTCHYPCGIANDDEKINCSAMSAGKCKECPKKCLWTKHTNDNYRYEHKECEVTKTMDHLSTKYKLASTCSPLKTVIQHHVQKLKQKFSGLKGQLDFIQTAEQSISEQLQSAIQSYNTQIDSVKRQMKPGYQERIKVLEQERDRAMQYL